jgi:Putative zinc-binding metallo-peptidase
MVAPARVLKASWHEMPDDELLDVRLCDLPLRIEGTPLEARAERVYEELERRGLKFRPHVWLSEEWFSPDGVPGFAIPFYLAHPRLIRLERKLMLEAEGESERECLRIMRHEAGHALSNAFRLHRRRRWRETFGRFGQPYPDFYKPDPTSRAYVIHLKAWYAQAHPAEDFAETFAVWLRPGSRWGSRYRDWPALKKLKYVAQTMRDLKGETPPVRTRRVVEPLQDLTKTLRQHYERKQRHYVFSWPDAQDRDLRLIFSPEPKYRSRPTAPQFLRRHRRELCALVADGTGVHPYAVDQIMENVVARTKHLKLRLALPEEQARRRVLVMLTAQTMKGVFTGYHRIPL